MWLAGAPVNFTITPLDAHGNPGASGGRFAAELICTAEAASEEAWPRSVECTVTETSSGATRSLAGILRHDHLSSLIAPKHLRFIMFPALDRMMLSMGVGIGCAQ